MIIDGKALAQKIKDEIRNKVLPLTVKPGLAVILVGDDPASVIYVNSKEKACQEVGFYSRKLVLPKTTTQFQLIEEIEKLNNDEKINGILVQLPLPENINEEEVIETINPKKDVDCFHPYNLGKLFGVKGAVDLDNFLLPCTPKGVLRLIKSLNITISGKKAVVIGRSNLTGKPTAMLLLGENATVEICHSKTINLAQETRTADILVAAVGQPNLVTADMVKKGAVVIDVGTTRTDKGLVGDCDFENVKNIAGFITPVPGGVGPMTIACLLENTLLLATKTIS